MTDLEQFPITAHQRDVALRELAVEQRVRHHIVIALTGAHAYGFASHDSDLDLKGVHVLPTAALVGMTRPVDHASRLEVIEEVEFDYASNEVGQVLAGLLRGIGSYIERILGRWIVHRGGELEQLAELTRGALSRRVHAHYAGFARSQLDAAHNTAAPTAKRLLYVLRTGLTGARLLESGVLVTDLNEVMDDYGFGHARELLEFKQQGERTPLPPEVAVRWRDAVAGVFGVLDRARRRSVLPEDPPNAAAMDAWLVALRRAHFDG